MTSIDSRAQIIFHLGRRISRGTKAHYARANQLDSWDRVSTFITVIGGICIIGATSAIVALPDVGATKPLAVVATAIGACVTAVGVAQAVWKWGQRAREHKSTGSRYANLRRKLQVHLLESPTDFQGYELIANEASELSLQAELIPARLWRKVDNLGKDLPPEQKDLSLELIDSRVRAPESETGSGATGLRARLKGLS